MNPLGIDPVGGAIGGGLMKIDPAMRFLNKTIFGSGAKFGNRDAVNTKSFGQAAPRRAQSAYNAPDQPMGGMAAGGMRPINYSALVPQRPTSTMHPMMPGMPASQPQQAGMGGGMTGGGPQPGRFRNLSATLGLANPSYLPGNGWGSRSPAIRPGPYSTEMNPLY